MTGSADQGMLTHLDLVILTRVNELAERFAVSPTTFLAIVHTTIDPSQGPLTRLAFRPATPGGRAADAYDAMLDLIGGTIADHHQMTAPPTVIIIVLEAALHCAPPSRTRGRSHRTNPAIPEMW